MSHQHRATNTRIGTNRRFEVYEGHSPVLVIDYKSHDRDHDPAFDEMDLEDFDFLFWVTRIWNDPTLKASLIASWSQSEVSEGSA